MCLQKKRTPPQKLSQVLSTSLSHMRWPCHCLPKITWDFDVLPNQSSNNFLWMYFRSNCSKSKWSSLHSRTLSHSCKSPGSSALKQYHAGFISAAPPAPILPFDIIVFVSTPFHDFAFLSHMELNVNFDVSIIPYGTIRYTLLSPWGDLVWTQVLSQQLPSLKYQKKKTIATDNNICNQRHKQVNQTAAYDAQFPYWEKR